MFIVYVIYNKNRDKIYIGQTENIEKRLDRHNLTLKSKCSSFTSINSGVWKVVYTERYTTRNEAIKREKELKSHQGRDFIRRTILGR